MPFFDRRRPRVYAHRGGCALGPENTIAAFDIGLAAGADGLELDVRLSADGVPVVVHDPTLDRTTDATGPVSARSADELARVDAGYRFRDRDGAAPFAGCDIGVPTLADVLRRYPGVPTIVELKVDSEDCGVRVAQVVCAADAVDRVCLAGYGSRSARGARQGLPSAGASACQVEVRHGTALLLDRVAAARPAVSRLSGARTIRLAACRVPPVCPAGPPVRMCGRGLDGGRAPGHGPAVGLGRRWPDQQPAGSGRGRPRRLSAESDRRPLTIQDRRIFAAQPGSVAS